MSIETVDQTTIELRPHSTDSDDTIGDDSLCNQCIEIILR